MVSILRPRRFIAQSVCILIASVLALSLPAQAEKYASIVVDPKTDRVLHARHADELRHPASLTKVMTLYMVFDEIEAGRMSLDDQMRVSSKAAKQPPSKIRVRAGRTLSVEAAIEALVTKSANDVAVVVAEHIAGTEDRFAALMTVKARMIGMDSTIFKNASGLHDEEQVTTARDMARLAQSIMIDHPTFYRYFSTSDFRYRGRTYTNHNKLLESVHGVDGIKTGYTRASGYNLMAAAEREDQRIIAVMLGGFSSRSRNAHVEDLLEAAFASLNEPETETPLRQQLAFEDIAIPVHPNAAAVPMLNGRPFVVEGDET